ncbi:hypothetical protein J6590_093190 [Homalodisca vitripennis]|nr:hypothetical protein J6590_029265 [Homalodisca vitripennis]KAG8289977.1 hypothetical protein J6590_093190 [Homalodisca vitripennis]
MFDLIQNIWFPLEINKSISVASGAWLLLGWVTAGRFCPCKQPACSAIGGGSEVTYKPLVPRLSVREGFLALTSPGKGGGIGHSKSVIRNTRGNETKKKAKNEKGRSDKGRKYEEDGKRSWRHNACASWRHIVIETKVQLDFEWS